MTINEQQLENRVVRYWTKRAKDWSIVRGEELVRSEGTAWKNCLLTYLPKRKLNILDVGTGTGFFCFLLENEDFQMTGIDLTPSMIEEAKRQQKERNNQATFMVMDAQELTFPDETFDAVISRNLTWTLPDVERAYAEWFRVLKKGGILLNFDANYKRGLEIEKNTFIKTETVYGHRGVTPEMKKENDEITCLMPVGEQQRPKWDQDRLREIGFSVVGVDEHPHDVFIQACSNSSAPLFMIRAEK